MPALPPDQLLAALRREGTRLADAAEDHLDAEVAACPGWTVADCVEHTGFVHRRVERIVRTGEQVRRRDLPGPSGGLLGWYRDGLTLLVGALETADPDAPTWTFAARSPSTVGWWMRRMAEETAVHRWDVESAGGTPTRFDVELAVDGIDEYLLDFLPGRGAEGAAALHGTVHLHATDAEGEWLVDLDDRGAPARREHAKADTAVRGSASDLLLWLWNRQPAAGHLEVFGDESVATGWTAIRI